MSQHILKKSQTKYIYIYIHYKENSDQVCSWKGSNMILERAWYFRKGESKNKNKRRRHLKQTFLRSGHSLPGLPEFSSSSEISRWTERLFRSSGSPADGKDQQMCSLLKPNAPNSIKKKKSLSDLHDLKLSVYELHLSKRRKRVTFRKLNCKAKQTHLDDANKGL